MTHHPRHDHVGDEQVDRTVVFADQPDRLRAIGRGQHAITPPVEHAAGDLADAVLVLDDQDDLAGAGQIALVGGPRHRRQLFGGRQHHGARGAEAGLRVEPDIAAGLGDDPVDRGQPEAGALALGLGGEERLEHPLERGRIHPVSVVAHAQADVAPRLEAGPRARVALVDVDVRGLDQQPAASRHRVAGVHGQVDQDLLHLARVGEYRPQVVLERRAQLDVLAEAAPQQLMSVADGLVEADHLGMDHLAAGKGEQLMGQLGSPKVRFDVNAEATGWTDGWLGMGRFAA